MTRFVGAVGTCPNWDVPVTYPLGAVPTIPKWYVIMMYLLGAVLTLLSFYVTGHTHWVQFLPYSAGMSLDIHIGCSTNLTQPRCR